MTAFLLALACGVCTCPEAVRDPYAVAGSYSEEFLRSVAAGGGWATLDAPLATSGPATLRPGNPGVKDSGNGGTATLRGADEADFLRGGPLVPWDHPNGTITIGTASQSAVELSEPEPNPWRRALAALWTLLAFVCGAAVATVSILAGRRGRP